MTRPFEVQSFALVRPDGSVAYSEIVKAFDEKGNVDEKATEELVAVTLKQIESAIGPFEAHPCKKEDFPADRTYRNAWRLNGGKVEHDMEHARELHRAEIRIARGHLLAKLDLDFMRALEKGEKTDAIVAAKQKLRDAPADPRIDAAKTIGELKAAWPL